MGGYPEHHAPWFRCGWGGAILAFLVLCSWRVAARPADARTPPEIRALRSVRVVPGERVVLATGWVNQVEGAIELLACGPGGKTHESVFVIDANAVDLQAGMLLLGLRPGKALPMLGHGPPEGPGVEIHVDWNSEGGPESERAERFIYNIESKNVPPPLNWVFTGSIFEDGQFKALAEESFVATFWDPWALFNIPISCGSNDEILVVNTNRVPPKGTPVTFRFKPAEDD